MASLDILGLLAVRSSDADDEDAPPMRKVWAASTTLSTPLWRAAFEPRPGGASYPADLSMAGRRHSDQRRRLRSCTGMPLLVLELPPSGPAAVHCVVPQGRKEEEVSPSPMTVAAALAAVEAVGGRSFLRDRASVEMPRC
jgi:hypothetical protein